MKETYFISNVICIGTAQEKNESPKMQLDLGAYIRFYLTKGNKLWKVIKGKKVWASKTGKL